MNKIFKVIWSKSKQCYVVVSEIAKNKTGKKKIVVAGIFAALAMVNGVQDSQAINGSGARTGWNSNGVGFNPTQGLVVGPNMNDNTTIANGNVATVAIGAHSQASGSSSVAIGGAEVNGAGAVGLGWATAKGDNSVALGGTGSTNANGNNAFAASGGNANGESATAIGSSAIADGRGGVAVGWNAESKVNAVGIGFNAKAKANNTIAIGVEANNDKANAISNNYSSVSIGVATRARAVGSMAMGVSADASGKYSIALGSGNVSGDYTATANYPKATGEKAIAIGYDGQALNINATAVGSEAHATGKQSAAYGFKSQASEQDATAIGSNAIASAVRTTALGVNAQALGSNSVAIGGGAGGTGVAGFAEELKADGGDITRLNRNINTATTAEGDNAVALGYYANAANGGVAIGQTSVAATGGVALGQRVLEDTGNKYASAVVIGQDSTAKGTYSVSIGRQTITKGSTSLAMGNGASANGSYSVAMGRKVVADDTSTAIGHHAYASKGGLAIGAQDNDISADRTTASAKGALAIGKNTKASAEDAVAIGTNAQSTLKGAVALGSGSTTATTATKQTSTTVNGIAYNFAGATSDPNMQVSVGAAGKERQIKNVAAGEVSANSTDAINGSQLFAVASQIKPINYFSVKSSAVGNKNNDGATGTDAVAIGPGAQSSGNNGVSLGNGSQANAESVVSIGYQSNYGAQSNSKSIGIGWAAGYQSNGSENIGIGSDAGRKLTGSNNVSIGKSAGSGDVYTSGSVLLGQSATIINSTKASSVNDVVAVGNGAQGGAASAVAIGKGAKALGFSTIAIGENSNAKTTTGAAPSLAIGRNTSANGDYAVALGGGDNYGNFQGAKAAGVGTTAIGAATVTKDNTNFQTAVGFGAKTDATNASAFGYNASATANNATALGYAASATAENATALGTGAVAKVKDGVAIGSGSKATVDKGVKGYNPNDDRTNKYGGLAGNVLTSTNAAVSVGDSSSVTRQITGVAAGTNNTDAVNVAQLKSVNLAFSGNSGNNDVNLANGTLAIKGDTTYITTTANTNGITIAGKTQDISVNANGVASANKGMADAKNVAQSINDAISKNAYTWTVSANGDAGESVAKSNKVDFNGDSSNITVERAGKKITTKLNKDITVDSVKANNKITVGTAAKQLVLDGTTGAMTAGIGANAIKLDGTSATITAGSGNNAISLNGTNAQAAFGSGTNAVSINGTTGSVTGKAFTAGSTTINTTGLTSGTGSSAVSFGTNGISAGNQAINNVATGGSKDSNAANIGDVKRYVSGATLNLTDGSNNGTVKLDEQKLKVSGSNGVRTYVNGQTVTVSLDADTYNATTKGIGIKGDSGFATKKYLKDGDAIFNVSGDGSLVTTKSTTTGVQVSVNSAKVKDLAVDAVTVSKATNIPDNPITVTPTAGTNSKDYAIGIDTTKLSAKTNLAYTANGATAKIVSLAKGLNFVNGTNTVSSVDPDGKVSFDLNQATKDSINKSATAVGRTITLNADSGTGSSQSLSNGNVSFAVSGATGDYISTTMDGSAVKVSTKRATINSDANTGAASVTGADGLATAKNVASAINSAVNGLSQNLNISDGTKDSSVALKSQKLTITGTGAATTTVNNQTITVDVAEGTLSNNTDGTVKADAAGVATTKNVADVINKTISDNQYSWKLSANGEATTATVGKGDTVDFTGDTNITVDRNNKNVSVSLNKNLTDMNSISLGNARGETIFLNGRDGSIKAGKAEFKDNVGAGSTITSDQLSFTNGATGANESTTTIALDTVSIQSGPNSSALTSKDLTFSDEDGNIAEGSAKGMGFQNAAGKLVQFTVDEIKAGGNKIKEVAEGTADTDAVNVKQLKDTIGGQSLTYRANTSADTDAKSVKLSKGLDFVDGTSTVATVDNDGKVSFDLNTATKTQINTNTTDIATNKDNIATNTADIATNKGKIAINTANIATNTANIAHTIALADDKGASTTAKSLKDGNVSFNIKGDNKFISTAASGNDVTLTVNEQAIKDAAKSASSFKVKANTHAAEDVKGGDTITFNNGDNIEISQTGKTFTIKTAKNITVDSVTAGNTVINTSGLTNGTTAITGTGITTDKVTVGGLSIDKTAGINAGGKVISNVASGTVNDNATDDSNAANIGDVKQAVANLSQNLGITDGTNNGTVDLKNQKLNVAGANGVTATVNNQTITVGLDANTVNATTKGIGLTADTGSTGNKYLKDGDVSFAVTGDGNLVSTSATAAGVKVAVDAAKVKDLAVAAVTVSKDTQADNPITVTPTAGTNSKDYAIGIDTTKLAAKTDLTYRANSAADANAKKVSLSKGLNFVDGGSTVATVDNDGKVSFDLNTATKNQINTNTTDITTNKGKIATNTTNIAANTTALARNISLGADTGTSSSQSLSTSDVAFNVKGATGDFVSTNMNGNTVEISTKRATINSNATTGEASVTGNDGLATAQNVADAINKAADAAKAGAAWNITTNSSTTDKTAVKGGDTVDLVNGDNIEITQDGTDKKKITVATKKDITVDSVTANNKVTVGSGANAITLNGADGSVTGKAFTGTTFTGTSFTAGNTVINTSGLTNGTTAITGTGVTTDKLTVGGISVDKTDGINAGGKVISNVNSGGTTDSNAANIGDVKQAVANLSQNLNITDGTNNGTIDLKNQKLNVAGANGVTTTVKDQTITVGLDANTVNATTKGIGLTGDTGSTGNKYLKDGDISFAVTGDGSLVSTTATAAGVKVAVNSASITAGADGIITGPTTDGVATAKNVANAINAAKKASKTEITANTGEAANATTGNVTLTSTTAADGHTIYDVKLNDKVTLGTGANAVTIDGTAGKATIGASVIDGVNNTLTTGGAKAVTLNGTTGTITGTTANIGGVTVNGTTNDITGLSNTTVTAADFATKGRAATEEQLKAATGATTLKFTGDVATNTGSVNLKDDTFGIKGDGKYISTDVNGKNVNLTVSEAEVKKSAVAAVTVSTDTTDANNPLTVTPTTSADGTTKDYKVTIDGTKIANKTNLSYKANDGTAKQVSLADGLNFKNGTLTTASIDDNGVVKYDVNTASITAGTDGKITGPTTDGVATANNVADAINAAKKSSKTEITANTGEVANATTGNVTLTSTTAADGHTIYDVKLNDKVTLGTGANTVTIDGTTGAITGKTATIGGVTVNGTANTIGSLSNTTWNGTATTGRAATEDQLKAVADAAGSQTWEITADKDTATSGAQTGTKKDAKVGKDDKVQLIAGENLTVNQNERDFTYSLNKDLVKMNSATFEATGGKTTVIKGDSIVQTDGANVNTSNATSNTITDGTNTSTITAGKAEIGTVGIDGVASKISTGGTNAVVVNGADGTVKTGNVTVTGGTTNDITGLSNTTLSATDFATKGRAATEEQLKAATGATTLKFTGDVATNTGSVNLKDDTFGIKGDGKYISTDVNGKNVNLTVSEAEVKKSAVAAVTVSTDITDANNPLTVTPTMSPDGTTKDYKVTIDGTKIANKTNLSYKANGGTAKQVSLADGLNFKNGTLTTASIDDAGVVKYDVNTATITAGTDGTITGPTTDGVATAKNVADAINAAKKASKTEVTANTGEAANATTGNVTLTSTTAADGHTIYDVKLNDKVTLGSGANTVTVDGTAAKVTAGVTTVDGATGTITTGGTNSIKVDGATGTVTGLTNKDWTPGVTKAVTGRAATEDQLQKVADAASSQTWNITADKAGTTGAQTGTKKNATVGKDETVELVAGDNLTINQDERKFTYSLNKDLVGLTSVSVGTGTTETIKLDGATGKITAKNAAIGGVTIDGDNKHVTGLSNTTWNGTATTGRAATEDQLKAVAETAKTTTDAVNLKFSGDTNTSPGVVNLKDDTLGIVGDGKYVSTDANGKNLTVKVSEAEVKKSAVAAVTVSTDTTDANNPLTVTPTTSADGTTKDYKVTIDGTKIASKTNLSYKANSGTAKQVSLADGLNFKNGTLTTASIDDNGVVKYDVNTAAITAGTDGTITGPTTDGVATAQNVADAINAAKKASKTEITANTGEVANATTGNVTLTSTTAADGHTIYDLKLNDKVTLGSGANAVTIDGTAGKATIGSSVINGVNNTFTTGGAKAVTLDGATGTITGTTANIGGVTVNGTANTIGGLSNTTWNGTATTGRAATEDQLKAVADAAGSQTWEITADKDAATSGAQTGTKKNAKVGKDDKVQLIAGENLTVNQNERDFTYSLNKDLVKMNSATFEATGGKTTVIKGDSIVQTDGANVNTSNATSNTITDGTNTSAITAGKGQIGSVGIDGIVSKITTGGANAVVINGADGTIKTGTVTVTGGTTNDITGLSNTTVTAADFATKGRAATEEQLKAATGATTLKFTGDVATNTGSVNLKDDTFGIKGDNKYISTDVNGKNVNLTVSEAEVKKSAVAAVTVSTDTTDANNPLTVTPTTSADGTTKDYKVTIDGTKIANKTNLSYKANDGTAKQVSLADGLNFKNGTLTTASIDDNGVVKYDVNTASITAGTDGTITGPTTDGVATAQNVADAINAAKKASKTEITANTGEAANATTGNVTLTSTTAADGHTIYDVKLNDKVTLGTGANAVTIDGTTGAITGKTATIGGVTVNGTANTIGGLSNTTWNGTATTGRAATEDQLKAVADAAGSQTWEITADKKSGTSGAQTGTKENAKVGKDDKVSLIAGENLTVDQAGKNFTYSLNTDLVKMNSATFEATGGKTTVIKGDSIVQTDGNKTNTATASGNTVANGTKSTETTADGQVIKDGAKSNKSTVDNNVIDDGNGNVNTSNAVSNTITDGTNTSTVTAGKATIGSSVVDGVNNTFTTGGANAVKLDGGVGTVKTGTVTVTGGTTNDITGLSNTTVTAADFATKGRAATEEQLKAVGEQTWQITADKDTATSGAQTGTKKDAKVGKDDKVQLIAGENLTVNQNERDFTYSLNKDLVKMNSATFEATGGKTTVIKGDSIVQTAGTQTNTSTAAGNTVADGTKSTETTATGQVIKDGTKTNTSTVDENTIVDGAKSNKTTVDSNVIDDGNGNVNTSNATSNTITDGTNTSAIIAGKATIGSSVVDGVNNTFTTGGANAVKLDGAAGTIKTGTVTVTGGTTNDIVGLSNTTVTAADFATKGRAATEEQLKAVGEQTWQITADKDATTSGAQTGTKKDAKVGKDDKVQLIAGENMTVNQNERDFTFTLNKNLVKMNSATFEATGGKTTVIKGDSIVQTDGNKTNTATASGNTVANGTKSTETTADGQVIKDSAKTNTSTVDENTLVDGTKSNKTTVDSNVIDDGNGNVNTSNATSNTITDGTNTSTITAGKATIGSSVVDGVNNTFTTGGANAVKLDGAAGTIKTGTVTVTGGTTNDIVGLSNTTVTAADFATKGRAATEEQLKAVGEQTWQITADKDATTSGAQTGTKKDAKIGKDDKVQLIAGENLTVNQNERDFTYSLNKDLVKMNSATFLGTGTNKTIITGDSITQTAGTQTNTSTAAGNTVANGTKSTETTAAGQVIKDGAKFNKSTVDSNVIDDGNGNVNTSNATSNTITDGTNTSTITAGKATIGSSIVDGVNNTFTTGGANAVKLDGAAGTIKTGTVTVTGGTTNDITGLSNTTVTSADFATKGRAATEEQLKAVGEQTWQITADKDATTSGAQTGTKKDAKVGKNDKVQLIAGENMTVNQNERDFTFTLNKDLVKMNSATFEATGGKTTVIKGDSIVQTDGTKVNTSTAGGNTVVDGTKSTATTADGTTVTSANGNTKYAADGVRINTTGKNPVSLTDAGLDNGNNVIKNVASGHVNNDATDNTNAANIADVKKATTTVTANAGEAANATKGNVTLTSTTAADGHTIYDVKLNDKVTLGTGANAVTIDGTSGKATIGSSVIDGVNNTFTTGGANAVKLDGAAGTIKTGTVTVTGGTTNDITGLSNTTVTSADFATKGRAATEEQLKAVGEQTWQITADKDAATSGAQTGTKKDAKVGKNDKVQLIAGENMTVNQNERDFTFTINKDLVKMNSATFLGTGTNKTVITGDSITQTAGTQTNTSTAAGNTVVDGTKSTETTATGQVIKDGAKTNTSTVDENTLVDGTKSNNTTVDSNVIDDGNGNVNTSNATSNTITDGTNTSTVIAGKATIGSSIVDGINNTFTTGGANAVKLDGAAGTIKTGTVTVTGGTTNDITGLSNTTVTAADFATKGRAATEEQLKAVGEQTWQITADKDATTSGTQTGTKKDAKVGKDDKVQLIAGENLTVNQNERDFTYSLNKDLVKMNSATFLGTGTNKTVITGDSITQTAGTQTNTSTAGGNTVVDGTKSTATTADGTTVTSANGNTKYAADGVRINTTGKNPVSLTDAGLDNGNNVIKNVASGHVNNDATDNTNAANIADVKKATTTVTANAGEAANATKGNVTLTSTTAADGHTIYDVKLNDKVILGTGANAVTIDGTAGKATIGSSIVDGVNNTFTTGGANAVKLDGGAGIVKTGTVTVTGGTTNDITGLSNTTVTTADFATKGRAATEEQLKAVGEQTWQITADKDAATSGAQTGAKKDAKVGKNDKVQLIAGENLTVNQNERDFTYSLNKDLVKMNSATFEATGGKTTVIKGDSIVQTAGTQTNTSTAAGNTVADGTKSTETTAAGQVIKDGTKTNTSTVDENTLVDGTKSNKTTVDSNVIDDGNGNVNTSNATSNTITDGTNASTITAGKATIGTAVIDGVNNAITTGGTNSIKLDGAAGTVTGLTNKTWTPGVTKAVSGRAATEDQLQIVADKVGAGWNVNSGKVTGSTGEANGSAKTNVASGEEVQLQAGNNLIIDQNGKTLAYSLNKNLKDMESATFNATGGKTTVIKGDSIVQTDGGKTNTSNAAGNTVIDGTKTTATTAAGTTITDGAKTNTSTADKNVIDDGAGNTNTSNATSNTITDGINTNTATATSNTLSDGANTNTSTATSNTLKNAAGDETKVDAKGATVKDAAGNTTNVASTGATVTNAAGDTTKVEATGTTVTDTAGNKATFTKDGVTITKPGKDTVSLTGNGLDNGNNKIVNVADGTAAKDAVNVSQLDAKTKAATTELTANGGQGANNTTGNIVLTKTTAADGHTIYDNKLNDKITLGAADPTKAITIDGIAGTITAGKDGNVVAIDGTNGTVKAGDGKNAVAIDGVNGSVKVADKITLNGKDGKAGIGTVGIDGKDGIITTGGTNPIAVNGKDGVVTGLTNKAWDPNNITSGRAATEDQIKSAVANAGWDAAVGSEGSGVNSTPTATAEKIKPNETVTFKAGNNMMVSQVGKTISYAVNPELTDMKSATFKDAAGNTTVTNGNGMTITPGSANPNNPNAGPVSLTKDGLHNGNNQIKGVAPGTDPTDAVNVSQLNASNTNTSQAINQVAGEVQRVGAHAAAMAALKPIQYDPLEPTQVMAGVGNYRGETAAALGLAHYTNENTMFNIGVSVGGNHNMVNAGVTHKFGYSPEKKNIPDRYKAGPISSVYVMQDEVSGLKKENAEQKYVIADQAARLNSLEAENERQRRELAETKQGLDDLRAAVDKLLASKG